MLSKLYLLFLKTKLTIICRYFITIVNIPNIPKKQNDKKSIVVVQPSTGFPIKYTQVEYTAANTVITIIAKVMFLANVYPTSVNRISASIARFILYLFSSPSLTYTLLSNTL